MTGAVLKVTCEGHIYRMPFDAELGCAVALTAVHELLPDAKVGAATFPGADGSNRVLTEDTFEEFLTTAMTAPSGRATFKLQMDLPGESAQQEQVAIAQPEPGPQPQGSGGGADGAKRPRSGAVRRAQRRQAKAAAEAARTQWEEDPRDLDQLVSAVEGAPWPPQVVRVASTTSTGAGGDVFQAEDKASVCATESTCEDAEGDLEEEEPFEQSPALWPATPESTPPSSPRCGTPSLGVCHSQFQPVFWVPVPVWIPVVQ